MRASQEELSAAVVDQHRHIRAIIKEVENAEDGRRQDSFDRLRRYLAVHEAAEQHFLHGPTQGELDENRGIVEARFHEEDVVAELMRSLEQMDVESVEFMSLLTDFTEQLNEHMHAEEHQEMFAVARSLSPEHLRAALQGLGQVAGMSEARVGATSYDELLDSARDSFGGISQVGA